MSISTIVNWAVANQSIASTVSQAEPVDAAPSRLPVPFPPEPMGGFGIQPLVDDIGGNGGAASSPGDASGGPPPPPTRSAAAGPCESLGSHHGIYPNRNYRRLRCCLGNLGRQLQRMRSDPT